MSTQSNPPDDLYIRGSSGSFDGSWFRECDQGASELGLRVLSTLHEEQTPYQTLTVYDTAFFGRVLTLDGLIMLTERDEFVYHEMLIHVPLVTLSEPKSILIIGGGDCGCLREALKHEGLERIVQCEIDERVTRVSEEWFPWVRPTLSNPRVELVFADAVAYIETTPATFDLVVVDSTDPKGPAVGLFLEDFYRKVARALRPGGIFTAQTESPHWSARSFGAIYAELRRVFPILRPYLGAVPTYPSGFWSWAYASQERRPEDFDEERAAAIAEITSYYNGDVHRAAFALPGFVRRALQGENPFERFDRRNDESLAT